MKKYDGAPIVSVLCIAYNQSKFIAQTLESLLRQKTDFKFEIIVHDDASTDGTDDIIRKYEELNPHAIRALYEDQNQYSKNGVQFLKDMYINSTGKYIAICEGDDYWTDEFKLQNQVDFLEKNLDCTLVFHPVNIITETGDDGGIFPSEKTDFNFKRLLIKNFIQTNSVLYRRLSYVDVPTNVTPFDWYMHLYHAKSGGIGFIDKVMAAYRKHPNGFWWKMDVASIWTKYGSSHLALYREMKKLVSGNDEYVAVIDNAVFEYIDTLVEVDATNKTGILSQVSEYFPETTRLYILRMNEAINELKNHSDKQAVIIKHYLDKSLNLEERNSQLTSSAGFKIERRVKRLFSLTKKKN